MVRLTADYIVKCNGHTKRKRDEPTTRYLKRITHLYMAERNIEAIDNLSACRNLTVLYLYDNKLNGILNLGTAQTLTHLYLQNNNISKIEGIAHLNKLTKLYIGYNSISVVEGLQGLNQLRELHVEHQRIPTGEKVLFDSRSLMGLSKCLAVLNIAGNNMDILSELALLKELVHVIATDNSFADFADLAQAIGSWRKLEKLELSGNPVCHRAKYRDHIIIMSNSLELLDGKHINKMERKFLVSWKASKEARRRQKLESRLMDLPPLQQQPQVPAPPPHYSIGGLPGGRKRFEAILAKSRSLPASAMPVQEPKRLQQYSSPLARPPAPGDTQPTMGNKSISDLTNRRSERQMTPHPNATRRARQRPLAKENGSVQEANGEKPEISATNELGKISNGSASASLMGQRRSFINSKTQQRFSQRTGFSGNASRFMKQSDSAEQIQGENPLLSAQGIQSLRRSSATNGGKGEKLFPTEGAVPKFGKAVFPIAKKMDADIGDQGDMAGTLAPLPSPRMDGEGEKVNGTTPRPVVVSP